jgi:hypothetical protein
MYSRQYPWHYKSNEDVIFSKGKSLYYALMTDLQIGINVYHVCLDRGIYIHHHVVITNEKHGSFLSITKNGYYALMQSCIPIIYVKDKKMMT